MSSMIRQDTPPRLFGQGAVAGYFAKNVTDILEETYVILPSFDHQLQWGPCIWQARDATTLPGKGDPCLVLFDNDRRPWVVAWVPS